MNHVSTEIKIGQHSSPLKTHSDAKKIFVTKVSSSFEITRLNSKAQVRMNKDATAPEAPPSYQETMGQQPYPNASAGAGKNNFLPFQYSCLGNAKRPEMSRQE